MHLDKMNNYIRFSFSGQWLLSDDDNSSFICVNEYYDDESHGDSLVLRRFCSWYQVSDQKGVSGDNYKSL
jgi:hypothetical protein